MTDTRSKRASAVQILQPWQTALVLPDGTISQADMQHIVWTYSGILAVAPVTPTTPASRIFIPEAETRTMTPASETRAFVPETETRTFTPAA